MTWLAWRQLRTQLVTAGLALAVLGVYLVVLGERLRGSATTHVAHCTSTDACLTARTQLHSGYGDQVTILGALLLALPAVIGIFWGAPLAAREVESGTHRLVWSQSITRTRWLAVKLAFVTLASVVVTGLLSLLLTWAAAPYDRIFGDRFTPLQFGSRNLAPIGYAVFACVLGITVGLVLRRTLPAMATTLVVVAALQAFMPLVVRPHLLPAASATVPFRTDWIDHADFIGPATNDYSDPAPAGVGGYRVPGALMLGSESVLLHADGKVFTNGEMKVCGDGAKSAECLATKDLHFVVTYQPADRYWPFQIVESLVLALLAAALAGFCLWRVSGERGLA
jgi:hypothetical protein